MAIRCSRISSLTRAIETPSAGSGSSLDPVGTNQKIGRNFPRLADLVDHLDGKRAPTRKNFRGTRARAQKFRELRLGMPEFIDGTDSKTRAAAAPRSGGGGFSLVRREAP